MWNFMGDHASKQKDRGTYGDMFGAVNSLFSGLAFAGIIYTILLQREELRLQREELIKSVEAQQESAAALEKQVRLSAVAAKINALSSLLSEAKQSLEEVKAGKTKSLAGGGSIGGIGGGPPQDFLKAQREYAHNLERAQGRFNQIKGELSQLTHSLDLQNLDLFFEASDTTEQPDAEVSNIG